MTVAGSVTDSAGNTLGSAAGWAFTTTSAVASILEDTTLAQFGAGTPARRRTWRTPRAARSCWHRSSAPSSREPASPTGWATGGWTGGAARVPGRDGIGRRLVVADHCVGRFRQSRRVSATFSGAADQNAGFADTLGAASKSWACSARTRPPASCRPAPRDAGGAVVDVALGSQYIRAAEHVFRIEWDTAVRFFIDGVLVHSAATVGGSMRPLASDYNTGGGGIVLRWMRLTASLPTIAAEFDGSNLPLGWTSTLWSGGSGGSAVSGGHGRRQRGAPAQRRPLRTRRLG